MQAGRPEGEDPDDSCSQKEQLCEVIACLAWIHWPGVRVESRVTGDRADTLVPQTSQSGVGTGAVVEKSGSMADGSPQPLQAALKSVWRG